GWGAPQRRFGTDATSIICRANKPERTAWRGFVRRKTSRRALAMASTHPSFEGPAQPDDEYGGGAGRTKSSRCHAPRRFPRRAGKKGKKNYFFENTHSFSEFSNVH